MIKDKVFLSWCNFKYEPLRKLAEKCIREGFSVFCLNNKIISGFEVMNAGGYFASVYFSELDGEYKISTKHQPNMSTGTGVIIRHTYKPTMDDVYDALGFNFEEINGGEFTPFHQVEKKYDIEFDPLYTYNQIIL